MRLTLRTLLAWLDDTLPPTEVRQIGQQVSESTFAKELVERIHRVTRQRRLTVPSSSNGGEANDPNIVASYLDNELTPEQVAEYEKRCLTSDVHLAEVASCHQILSLIGQRAKVPPEARHRMYRLVRGREAAPLGTARALTAADEPTAAPVPPWTPPPPPRRSSLQRYGPVAAVAGLLLLLIWSAWSLQSGRGARDESDALAAIPKERSKAGAGKAGANAPEKDNVAGGNPRDANAALPAQGNDLRNRAAVDREGEFAGEGSEADLEKEKKSGTEDKLPPGAVGMLGVTDGILLRFDEAERAWERLQPPASIRRGDRLVSLDPFRIPLELGKAKAALVSHAEIRAAGTEGDEAAHLEFSHGELVIRGATEAAPVGVTFRNANVVVWNDSGGPIGFERINHRLPGSKDPGPPTLRVYSPEGETAVEVAGKTTPIQGPGWVEIEAPDKVVNTGGDAAPSWVTEENLPALAAETGDQFAAYFKPDVSPLRSLVEAMEDEQPRVRQLAISALAAIGGLEMIVPALSRPDDPSAREAVIQVLRSYSARSPEATEELHTQLVQVGGEEWARLVENLLVGYPPDRVRERLTYDELVPLLEYRDVGVRQLAIDQLRALTGRDALGYDPDEPEGPGLQAWHELLKTGDIIPKGR